ncbi:MAG TPA: hypothetical protein VKA30_08910 [Actinomycetota bacterium]|nr:hypothetical protein [Actinomycetota bacterium]
MRGRKSKRNQRGAAAAEPARAAPRSSRERRITYTRLVGLAFCVAGFTVIGLGWNGMARVACADCQLPYLLSGGATGLGLIIFGVGLLMMAQIRADRLRAEVHLEQIVGALRPGAVEVPSAETAAPNGEGMVVAGSTAYHRPECRLLQGKAGLTSLSLKDAQASGLVPCRVCNPLEQDSPPVAETTKPTRPSSRARRT